MAELSTWATWAPWRVQSFTANQADLNLETLLGTDACLIGVAAQNATTFLHLGAGATVRILVQSGEEFRELSRPLPVRYVLGDTTLPLLLTTVMTGSASLLFVRRPT